MSVGLRTARCNPHHEFVLHSIPSLSEDVDQSIKFGCKSPTHEHTLTRNILGFPKLTIATKIIIMKILTPVAGSIHRTGPCSITTTRKRKQSATDDGQRKTCD